MFNVYKTNVPDVYEKCRTCTEKIRHVFQNPRKTDKKLKTKNQKENDKNQHML